MTIKDVARFDKGEIKVDAKLTEDGYIRATAIVTRSGIFHYRNPDGTIRKEFRPEEEVFKKDSLETLKMIPITNGHPQERLVNASNAKRLAIGYTGESIQVESPYLSTNLVITDSEGVKAVKEKGRKQLSLGYTVDLLEEPGEYEGERYDCKQTNIRYNHLSLVDEARAGPIARIALDRLDGEEINPEECKMTQKKIKIKNDEYMVEPAVAEGVDNLRDEVERIKMERMELERRVKDLMAENERLKGEIDSMRDRMHEEHDAKEKMDQADKFRQAVKERVKLEETARRILDRQSLEKLDSMDDIEIKKQIITSRFPTCDLSGKSEIYINGRFDGVVETLSDYKASYDPVMKSKMDSKNDIPDPIASKNRMLDRAKNAYKSHKQ